MEAIVTLSLEPGDYAESRRQCLRHCRIRYIGESHKKSTVRRPADSPIIQRLDSEALGSGFCGQSPVVATAGKLGQHMDAARARMNAQAGTERLQERVDQVAATGRVQDTHPAQMSGKVALLHEVGHRSLRHDRARATQTIG